MTTRLAKLAVLLVLVSTVAAACDRGQTRSDDADEGTRSSNGPDDLYATEGNACSSDPDCSGYLRCLDGTCQIPPAVEGDPDESTPVVTLSPSGDGEAEPVDFYVELATTPAERRRGLMYRRELADGWGMLFVYPDEAPRSFWMKNTYIPLDIVFIDADGRVVNVVESAEPETLTGRPSDGPAQYVLEVNGGVAADTGIAAGWRVSVDNVPDEYAPDR